METVSLLLLESEGVVPGEQSPLFLHRHRAGRQTSLTFWLRWMNIIISERLCVQFSFKLRLRGLNILKCYCCYLSWEEKGGGEKLGHHVKHGRLIDCYTVHTVKVVFPVRNTTFVTQNSSMTSVSPVTSPARHRLDFSVLPSCQCAAVILLWLMSWAAFIYQSIGRTEIIITL